MILEWIERQRLARKRMACDKFRMRREDPEGPRRVDRNRSLRLAILAIFSLLLQAVVAWSSHGLGIKQFETEQQFLVFFVFLSGLMLLELECGEIWNSNSKLVLVLSVTTFNILMIKALIHGLAGNESPERFYFLCPCGFAPLLLTLLAGPRAGLYTVLQVSLVGTLVQHRDFSFLMFGLLSGFTAVYFSQTVRKRSDLITAGMAVGITNFICAIVLGLTLGQDWATLGEQALFGIGSGIMTALFISGVLPIFEGLFKITTPISWIELADLNHPLLQQMTIEAPGSYHHSLVVANLVEAAAKSIDLDPTPCRVMAYFHDIGKMIKPEYFTENIAPGMNPHDNLSPNMSALIIVAHVKEGIDLALKYHLNRSILDAIQQHHGDSLVYYFYRRAIQQQEDAREGSKIMKLKDVSLPPVEEGNYRYPGPRPKTKQVGLLCIADAVEAASRSLDKPTPQRIDELVREIIANKISDGQLDESNLTLNELRAAGDAMATTVKNMMHTRIGYAKKGEKISESALIQSAKRGSASGSSAAEAA